MHPRHATRAICAFAIIVLVVLARPVPAPAQDCGDFCLFVPAFDGAGALGRNVSTVLILQLWSTYRERDWLDPNSPNFGKAGIIWENRPMTKQSHGAAEALGKAWDLSAQMVLWGRAYPYGTGVVVQPRLSMPSYIDGRVEKNEIWSLSLYGQTVSLDLPSRRYELSPIVLAADVVQKFRRPAALTVYGEDGQALGPIGPSFIGTIFERGRARVISRNGRSGWVRFPELADKSTALIDFIAALIRIYRADWEAAATALRRVLGTPKLKPRIAGHARLLLGMALDRRGLDGRSEIEAAYRNDPYSDVVVRYLVMSNLTALKRAVDAGNTARVAATVARLRKLIADTRHLFPPNDPWMRRIGTLITLPR